MKTDKQLLKDFREKFHPQVMLHENHVLVLMGMARTEETKAQAKGKVQIKRTRVH
jgi:hypothetical protein